MGRKRICSEGLSILAIKIPISMRQQLDACGNVSALARRLFAEYLNRNPNEEEKIRKRVEELEPYYLERLSLKAQLEEIEKSKAKQREVDLDKERMLDRVFSRIAEEIHSRGTDAHKLRGYVEQHHRDLSMSPSIFEEEFEKRHPGLLARVYRSPVARRQKP